MHKSDYLIKDDLNSYVQNLVSWGCSGLKLCAGDFSIRYLRLILQAGPKSVPKASKLTCDLWPILALRNGDPMQSSSNLQPTFFFIK